MPKSHEVAFDPDKHTQLSPEKGGGFVDKSAVETEAGAEKIAAIAAVLEGKEIKGTDILEGEARVENRNRNSMRKTVMGHLANFKTTNSWNKKSFYFAKGHLDNGIGISFDTYSDDQLSQPDYSSSTRIKMGEALDKLSHDKEVMELAVGNGYSLEYAAPELQGDKNFVLLAVQKHCINLQFASDELKKDKEVVTAAIKQNPEAFVFAAAELQTDDDLKKLVSITKKEPGSVDKLLTKEAKIQAILEEPTLIAKTNDPEVVGDKNLILKLVQINGKFLRFASEALRADREVVLAATAKDVYSSEIDDETGSIRASLPAISYAAPELRADKELMLPIVRLSGLSLRYASEELKNDKPFVLEAIKNYARAYESVGDKLKDDPDVVYSTLLSLPYELEHMSDKHKADKELIKRLVGKQPSIMVNISAELLADKEFMTEIIKLNPQAFRSSYKSPLRKDRDFILQLLKETNGSPWIVSGEYANSEFMRDPDFVLEAVKINPALVSFASDSIQAALRKSGINVSNYNTKFRLNLGGNIP